VGSFIGSVVIHVAHEQRASAFWRAALGYVAQPDQPAFLAPPEGAPSAAPASVRGPVHLHLDGDDRMHLDLFLDEGDTLESEVERLVALGARRVEWTYAPDAEHVVLADPDGNLFCVCR